jgi:hypothetical protein
MDEQRCFAALHDWFLSPQGQDIVRACAAELQTAPIQFRGKYGLQIGACGKHSFLDDLHYQTKWLFSPEMLAQKHSVIGSVHAMPFERESMDCIIAPMTLEICGHEKMPLDEFDRILKPMGYVVFFGINLWSFWGIALRWGHLAKFAHSPAMLSSSLAVKHAMRARGYTQCFFSSFYYLPPVKHEYWLRKLEFLNQMSKMVWPYPAGFYCLVLQKYDPCMTLSSTVSHDWHLAQI